MSNCYNQINPPMPHNCGCGGGCSDCARIMPIHTHKQEVKPCLEPYSYAQIMPNINCRPKTYDPANSIFVNDGKGDFGLVFPTQAKTFLRSYKITQDGPDKANNLEIDYGFIEASDILSTSWNSLPDGSIPASKIFGVVTGGNTGTVRSVSINGSNPISPDANGNVNLPISGNTVSTVAPSGITGLSTAGNNKYVGTDSTGTPGIYSLPTAVSGGGITSITEGFGTDVTSSGGVATVSVDPNEWLPATANGGFVTNNFTELLGKDGNSYKLPIQIDKDQGEIYCENFFPSNWKTTTPTTYTWVCPVDVTRVRVKVVGGGAAGNIVSTQFYNQTTGMQFHTGMCGSILEALVKVTPGQSYPISIGGTGNNSIILAPNSSTGSTPGVGLPGQASTAFGVTASGGIAGSPFTWGNITSVRHDLNISDTSSFPPSATNTTDGLLRRLNRTSAKYFETFCFDNANFCTNGPEYFRFYKNSNISPSSGTSAETTGEYYETTELAGLAGCNVLVDNTLSYGVSNSRGNAGMVSIEFIKGHGLSTI